MNHSKRISRIIIIPILLITLTFMSGCAAIATSVSKRKLNVHTKMSSSVFLDPVPVAQKTVYVDVRNTSDHPFHITHYIDKKLQQRGYHIVHNPRRAHYLLQVNILRVGKFSRSAADSALSDGFGGGLAGGAIGAGVGALAGGTPGAAIAGGIIGATVGIIADASVKDVNYSAVADIQISERTARNEQIHSHRRAVVWQGNNSKTVQTSNRRSHWKRYRTRIVSSANKANLHYRQAKPRLEYALAHGIAGIF